ncbi:DUF6449 domain-containing protein [Bacillus sp. NEB1478]|uniref:DUF6449 domain-containing protein n=1 Tax=Bacillus sp. NEB1478 TaxID=3073816 RepID=UPI0028733F08|nr:DUF6449 domain-containing protein [Bacillus sp. NEB1478]WNB91199.1 DUF6449 domain-containing protein [Bacillus sp. NEB1478]
MPSKTSWFNREIIIQSLRNSGWIGIVYFLGLVFALPLRILMDYTRTEESYYQSITDSNLFDYHLDVQVILMFGIPIILAIFLFRYLQVKNAADFMHSIPVKRSTLYNHYVCMGILFLLLPILLVALILVIMHNTINVDDYFTLGQISDWIVITFVVSVFIFMATVFVGMLTGISAVQGVFSFVLLIFPLAISILIAFNLSFLLYGFPDDYYIEKQFEKYSPITLIDRLADSKIGSLEILIYLLLSIILFVLALQLYKLRKIEMVSQAISFPQLKPVFIYGLTFSFMLFGGLYFGETQQQDLWVWFGYIAGSLIGYLIAQMVVEKTWRVFRKLKGYGKYAAVMAILFVLFQFDITGYEKRVPEVQEIEGVYVGDGYYDYSGEDDSQYVRIKKKMFTTSENIKSVHDFHQELVKGKNDEDGIEPIFLLYKLKDGGSLTREYKIKSKKQYSSYLKPIYESSEYKKAKNPLLTLNTEKIKRIQFNAVGQVPKSLSVSDPKEIAEILKALMEDIKNESFEEQTAEFAPLAYVEVYLNNKKTLPLDIKPNYKNTQELLKDKNKLQDTLLTAEDLKYAVIFKNTVLKRDPESYQIDEQWAEKMVQEGSAIKVTEKKELEESLKNFSYNENGKYGVALFYENEQADTGSFNNQFVPDFVKQQLK